MGLLAGQLGNVAQSSVGDVERSEVGGLQYTAQNLGSSLGTALIGSFLLGGLTRATMSGVAEAPLSDATREQVGTALEQGISFLSLDQARAALAAAGITGGEADALIGEYARAQLVGLKIALLAAAGIALASVFLTRDLPHRRATEEAVAPPEPVSEPPVVAPG